MPVRKTPRADLQRQYPVALQVGALLALGVVLAAFTIPYRASSTFDAQVTPVEQVTLQEVQATIHEPPPPPPPKPPPPVEVPDTELIDDTEILIDVTFDPAHTPPLPPPPRLIQADPEPEPVTPEVFVVVENPPQLLPSEAGAMAALQQCIRYPAMAREAEIQGRVFVRFIVDEYGTVTAPRVLRGIGGGADEEALRCVQGLRFRPGMQRGRAVKVEFSLPVHFVLR
ncbi:MAG: energy transducer TonB [Bacteroidota bacterium]